ncbi:DUF2325 domain-containing protein [Bacillus marasmi]|uniref:DUF2325 domain-containing protein n=1 Tax=Bacillus marasmi TaxID=1926279 RepID=UPI0011C7E484|nr:DUF2325 domain-containing protein [Bacillus marasmi]
MRRKNEILSVIKEEIQEKLELLNFENLEKKQAEITTFFSFLQALDTLPFENHHNVKNQDEKTTNLPTEDKTAIQHNEEDIEEKSAESLEQEQDANSIIGTVYRFERKLRGGVIPELDEGYIIPEKMVRDMNADDGDLVRVVSEKGPQDHKSYRFVVEKKSNQTNKSRVELRFCNVEKEVGELVVKTSQGRMIKLDEVPYTFIIREKDVDIYHLHEGDIIDIAYYKENPMKMKVIYKHEIEEPHEQTLEQKRLLSHAKCHKGPADEKNERQYPVNLHLFKNKKVLVVGGESRHADYADAFNSLNFELETITGNEGEKRLCPSINRADVIVIIIGETSHAASIQTVKICKEINKPFATTYENGIQSVLLCAEEAIKKGMEMDQFNVVS